MLLDPRKEVDRSLIFSLRTDRWKETPNGFNIVIEDLRILAQTVASAFSSPSKSGINTSIVQAGFNSSDLSDRFGKDPCSAIR